MNEPGCPLGGPRCPPAICDCFIDTYPDDPLGLHPEAYAVWVGGAVGWYRPPPLGAAADAEAIDRWTGEGGASDG